MISYNFPPFADASAATVAKRIRDAANPVDVVSQNMSAIRSHDPQLERFVKPYVRHLTSVNVPPTFGAWRGIRNFVEVGYAAIADRLSEKRYLRMYSRSMFPASHVLAAYIKSRHPEIRWIAEFSDPIAHTVEGSRRSGGTFALDPFAVDFLERVAPDYAAVLAKEGCVFKWCEYLVYALADVIGFTNEHQRDEMIRAAEDESMRRAIFARSIVDEHPTLPDSYYGPPSSTTVATLPLRVGYFGEFYPNRGLGDLFAALSQMAPETRQKIQADVYTSNPDRVLQVASEYGIESCVEAHEALPFMSFLRELRRVDFLFVNDVFPGGAYRENPYLPSKLSDYLGAGVPIISMIWPNSAMAKKRGLHHLLSGDIDGLRSLLMDAIVARGGACDTTAVARSEPTFKESSDAI
ncbi:hypothetical protein ACQ7DA_07625 [Zafaria sp. J156]|uniref:hypothetical protein n=1 Tax=Zafaria sp. J156 TaxID=3116490 RepID=UPI002E78D487|nr:hypothetical protein [Zafaria sp. J156]MEE1620760.1 hypothetical protein [Zafaria sp. J156]